MAWITASPQTRPGYISPAYPVLPYVGDASFHPRPGPYLKYTPLCASDPPLLRQYEIPTTRGHCNMAQAELRGSRYPGTCTDGRRTHTVTHRHDHRLLENVRPDRVAEEKLVGRLPHGRCYGTYRESGSPSGNANEQQIFSIGTTVLVIMATQMYGWDKHVWDMKRPELSTGRKVRQCTTCVTKLAF